ncbi:hypothetical protein ONR57_12505 [Hoyosella sp. YIM 151337]|uniref:hypothetical protein n=1 Tax=Hoyosella sp. YIM 151337 TaxID=2992742 RepID=UPI0022355113|nr:hypothetical protein [Hoyosella sp. YIM 151337]MCW4354121.1 hypothetical protein [Hoyosella sp. YIM 151337]
MAGRLAKTRTWVNVYRARLIDPGLIHPAGHGLAPFTAPYMRDRAQAHEAAARVNRHQKTATRHAADGSS